MTHPCCSRPISFRAKGRANGGRREGPAPHIRSLTDLMSTRKKPVRDQLTNISSERLKNQEHERPFCFGRPVSGVAKKQDFVIRCAGNGLPGADE